MTVFMRSGAAVLSGLSLVAFGCTRQDVPEVVVYVAVDRGQAEPILQDYQRQTGVEVRAVYDAEAAKTTGLVSRLVAEAGRPRCDVFWNNELVQTLHLARRGVLDEFRPRAAHDIPKAFQDPHGRWTGIATRARVIVYNTRHVAAAEAPQSLWDLTLPKWKGRFAVANPQFGTTRTHIAALFAVLGPEKTQELLRGLLANDVRIVDGNAMVKNLVARADPAASPVYVGLTDTDDVLAGQAEGEPVAMIYPDQETIGTLVIPTTVCLVRGAPHRAAAEQLIEHLVGPQASGQLAAEGSGYRDVRRTEDQTVKAFSIESDALLEQLEPSSRWTQEHFHP
jgi:iron(III) transport system substrate-binding protein